MAYPNPTMPIEINISIATYPLANEALRRYFLVSDGATALGKGEMKAVNISNYLETITSNTNKEQDFAKSFFLQAEKKTLYVLETKGASSASEKLKVVEKFVDDRKGIGYMYWLPNTMLGDAYLGTLLAKYNTPTSQTYFIGELDNLPDSSSYFTSYAKDKKSFFAVYPTVQEGGYITSGIIMGIMASGAYDISSGNQLTPLQNKKVNVTPKELTPAEIKSLTDAPASWLGSISGENVVLGTRLCDGETWDYWYAVDNIYSRLINGLSALIVNCSNGGSPLKYNDIGVKMLQSKAITILETCQSLGFINAFAEFKDEGTGELQGVGSVAYIPVSRFKIENPDLYKKSIYSGLSSVIEAQRFILNVIYNINIQ